MVSFFKNFLVLTLLVSSASMTDSLYAMHVVDMRNAAGEFVVESEARTASGYARYVFRKDSWSSHRDLLSFMGAAPCTDLTCGKGEIFTVNEAGNGCLGFIEISFLSSLSPEGEEYIKNNPFDFAEGAEHLFIMLNTTHALTCSEACFNELIYTALYFHSAKFSDKPVLLHLVSIGTAREGSHEIVQSNINKINEKFYALFQEAEQTLARARAREAAA